MAEITDRESLERWLRDKPRAVSVAIAARAALRVLPVVHGALGNVEDAKYAVLVEAVFRSNAIGRLAYKSYQKQASLRAAGEAAGSACYDAKGSGGIPQTTGFAVASAAAASHAGARTSIADAGFAVGFAGIATFATWDAVNLDVKFLGERLAGETTNDVFGGHAAADLMRTDLWPNGSAIEIDLHWNALRHALKAREGENWQVWTEWYEDVLSGGNGIAGIEALELEKALIPNDDWEKGPAHVNALIAEMIERHTSQTGEKEAEEPDQPEPRPTPIRFEFRDGKLQKAPSDPPAALDQRQATAEQALRGLLELLDDLMAADPGRNSPKLGRLLDRIRAALGDEFASIEIGLLGVHADRLNGYAAQADRILMEEDAADLVSLNAQLGIFVGQFPEWSDYLAGVSGGFGPPEAESKAVDDAGAALEHLKAEARETLADDAVAELDALRDEATPEPSAEGDAAVSDLAKRSFLRAFRDGIAKYCGEAVSKLREGSLDGMKTVGKNAVVVGVAGGSGFLLALATGLPAEFGWLTGMVTYIRRMLRRADPDAAKNLPDDVMDA